MRRDSLNTEIHLQATNPRSDGMRTSELAAAAPLQVRLSSGSGGQVEGRVGAGPSCCPQPAIMAVAPGTGQKASWFGQHCKEEWRKGSVSRGQSMLWTTLKRPVCVKPTCGPKSLG